MGSSTTLRTWMPLRAATTAWPSSMHQHGEQHQQHQQEAAQSHLRAASGFQHPHQAEHQRKAEVHPEVNSEDV